jgi:4-hydroxythreonine-4-phosphate dehydrogenase
MTKTTKTTKSSSTDLAAGHRAVKGAGKSSEAPVVISMGCPRGIGPEVSLSAALSRTTPSAVIVGSRAVLGQAASALGLSSTRVERIFDFSEAEGPFQGLRIRETGPELSSSKRAWGKPSPVDGVAQLAYIEAGYELAKKFSWPLVTAPVSKEVIARSGEVRAKKFRGHTEWLEMLDGASHSVMCFASPRLATSLVTTHVPVRQLSKLISEELIVKATLELVDLLLRTLGKRPRIAVCSLNPHGGEGKLLGDEEARVILPGVTQAAKMAGKRAQISGPIGAETAYRHAANGTYDGVVAMYHDQATIPMKLLDFGGAVNITQGLSIVRTSVDHGTAYDIAGRGIADARGMIEAMKMGKALASVSRKIPHGTW